MSDVKFTKTATFLFPLLGIPKALFKCNILDSWGRLKFDERFLNAYLKNDCIEKYKDKDYVFVVLRNYQDVEFDKFCKTLQAFPNYVDEYDVQDCLIVVFSVPEENQEDFNLIKQGLYSQVSKKGRDLILANNYFTGKIYTLPLILTKAKVLKEMWEKRLTEKHSPANLNNQEVWSIISEEKETLTEEVISTLTKKKNLIKPQGDFV
jgi:hypothetical protein